MARGAAAAGNYGKVMRISCDELHRRPRLPSPRMSPVPSGGERGEADRDERLRCDACGDVIGVYEPLIVVQPDGPLCTSAMRLEDVRAPRYHRACYATVLTDA